MSESQDERGSVQLQPKIASFAPELIDAVIDHLGSESLKPYSFISRNWRGPVQRRRMQWLIVRSGTWAEQVADGVIPSGHHVYVHTLDLRCRPERFLSSGWYSTQEPSSSEIRDDDRLALDHFLALLPLFPNLQSLRLEPNFTHFNPSALSSLQRSEVLPHLSSLHVQTMAWFRDTVTVPNLYAAHLFLNDIKSPPAAPRKVILEQDEDDGYYSGSVEEKDRMREVVQACERGKIELVVKDRRLQKLVEEMN